MLPQNFSPTLKLLHFNFNFNTNVIQGITGWGRTMSDDIEGMDEEEELEFKDKLELRDDNDEID